MQEGKFNVILDAFWGSSGKGKVATWLADRFNVTKVSSSNYPNAGHTAKFEDGTNFVAKAIPTAAILKRVKGMGMECFLSPGSGFFWDRLVQEWEEAGRPKVYVHGRASIVTPEHARREREGSDSTKHIASTMQGSGAAISDKVMRRPDCVLAWNSVPAMREAFAGRDVDDRVSVVDPAQFREMVWGAIGSGHTWLHEGSQGFALSIDHGSHYPFCLSGDSMVIMEDGTPRKIRNIGVGDMVLSMDQSNRIVPRKVIRHWERPTGSRRWFNVVTETSTCGDPDRRRIKARLTGDHKIRTSRGMVTVEDLVFGDQVYVLTYCGSAQYIMETVLEAAPSQSFHDMDRCYDIEVEDAHNFFVKNDKGAFNVENCTSRNCTLQMAMDQMAIPPAQVGDVYLNLRSFPIRVGNVVEDGERTGYSGDFYPDCEELTWERIAAEAGMPAAEAAALAERERTTVTKRVRRVCGFSFHGLKDAVRVNGATKLILNFVQYLDWKDAGLRGGPEAYRSLSSKSRQLVEKIEDVTGLPVVLIGTGALNDDVISRY